MWEGVEDDLNDTLHVGAHHPPSTHHTFTLCAIFRYTEAISCGKGRDMGFNSILTFETKISCGNGEVSGRGAGRGGAGGEGS